MLAVILIIERQRMSGSIEYVKSIIGRIVRIIGIYVLLSAGSLILTPSAAQAETVVTISGAIAPRVDTLNWNIAGNTNGQNPNILSELTWSSVASMELSAGARFEFGKTYFIKARGAYAPILSGKVRDSDYNGDNRTKEFSRSQSETKSDSMTDISIAVGFKADFEMPEGKGFIGPFAGYSDHRQNLNITNGVQIIPVNAPIVGLNSSYDAKWAGPLVGLEFEFNPGADFELVSAIEFHLVDYNAVADWNLRQNFAHPKSFTHTAFGYGVTASIGLHHRISEARSIFLGAEVKSFAATNGIDRTYLTNGTHVDTRLNAVNWGSMMLKAQLDFDL